MPYSFHDVNGAVKKHKTNIHVHFFLEARERVKLLREHGKEMRRMKSEVVKVNANAQHKCPPYVVFAWHQSCGRAKRISRTSIVLELMRR